MPLHTVPIIIGTTLAIVGSSYVFKKFIYDPHLAPLLEALLAAHRQTISPSPSSQRNAIPMTTPSSGTSTARRDNRTTK
ncbi:MAG: hypothetical protein TREMPRED_005192, partial [Tremellales sp. Tagirdzhanova-0007]